ncbi:two-component system, NtrC family, response regulator [Desulfocicer vacuolatum DSM 3385]|uniref:Two-component system, NtrC family, response regulator n=1 Tax=Desulfocicer vacuolatum DSM 3385 TaxID=1121400 RepID=A0A1W2EEH4_9BACT|nr:sigma-54 dependent transcriptional regulator [Desulfocicer vacuolatum]SMD08121.1 two-component system, NtrC family, response regulator [Desulfocicer vacuolatum DSM 3385]
MTSTDDGMKILVVDDEKSIRRLLQKEMASPRRNITTAGTAAEALATVAKDSFDIIILDINLPDANGIELMSRFQESILAVQIILITGYADVDDAVNAMKIGAYDYITKPFDLDRLELVVEKAYQKVRLKREQVLKRQGMEQKRKAPRLIVGHSAATDQIRYLIDKVAPTSVPVLITGESGTGKNVVARQLHSQSLRADQPLITKNCATLQEELIRSELFGYCKGAFTGAEKSRNGLLAMSDKGTLFLDEIGELSVGVQASLLRVMENQTFRPVGDKNEIKVDIRFMFATNRDLKEEVAQGRFNEALFHRLNVFTLKILPLRQRKEELPVLVDYFLSHLSPGDEPYKISPNAMACLMAYDWPGNVRELRNVMERGCILAENNTITERGLPMELVEQMTDFSATSPFISLKELEKQHILKVMHHVEDNRCKAAEILGIGRKTLYRKLQSFESR